ncbi:ATP-grasp domain-containing protein [Streptomyces sp. NPDC006476]|uniref:preATP grasp domain-containing protein n=1 Tax=Streptomyces sp. NPDC006476 TaxID=3157175 RepID=UPI0033A60A1B
MSSAYLRGLKKSLTGNLEARLVFLCNFEVEHTWAHNYVGLPMPKLSSAPATVQRMEELGALLAGSGDVICLGAPLDPGFKQYAADLGFRLPTELVVPKGKPGASTGERILASPDTLRRLAALADGRTYLMPMGASATEQKVSESTGLPLAAPDSDTMERVNGKIYGRRLVEELGIRPVPGECCETVDELTAAVRRGIEEGKPLIVKESYGVSGKGLIVLDTPVKAERLLRMARQRTARTGSRAIHVVVERFLAKKCDLNYQFTIDRAGGIHFDFVKEAQTADGVHLGHVMPTRLSATHLAELEDTARRVGKRLHTDGLFGVVGVDAILGADDTLYPVLEINARLNMSSYQGPPTERFLSSGAALAKHYVLDLEAPVPFHEIESVLGPLAPRGPADAGAVITCFGTVNAEADRRPPFEGRLYTMLFAQDRDALAALDAEVRDALSAVPPIQGIR